MTNYLIDKLYETHSLEQNELAFIIKNATDQHVDRLNTLALKTKLNVYGRSVYLRALLEFTNYCRNSCFYCGIRKENQTVNRYRLSEDEILKTCVKAYKTGYRTVVLQGGEDVWFTTERLVTLIQQIKNECPETAVTLSIGEKSAAEYESLFEAGVDRFLLRHETTSEMVYKRLHPGMSFKNRVNCLQNLKLIGYQTGAGFIVGLDEQSPSRLAQELLFLKSLDADMVGIGPLVPHPQTPMASYARGSVHLTLMMMALTRLLLPGTLIPIATALNTLSKDGWEKGLQAGANVLMPVVTPFESRKDYEIYKDKNNVDCIKLEQIREKIKETGFEVDMTRGDSKNYTGVRQ